jgi:hypothetical protein
VRLWIRYNDFTIYGIAIHPSDAKAIVSIAAQVS